MTTTMTTARACWRTLEPYHGMIYFVPEAADAYAAEGVIGRSGYFASRSAPMGAVRPLVVRATFFNFHPTLVERSMAGVWDTTTPGAMIAARCDAADQALRRFLGDAAYSDDMAAAVDLIRPAVEAAAERPEGRPLFAGHAQLDWPDAPHLALWHAITVLREFRGDGHVAALTEAGLSGVEALVLHGASAEVPMATLQTTRAWPDDEWAAAIDRLGGRGLVIDGALTDAGVALRDGIERRTDELAAPAWNALSDADAERLRGLVRPWSKAISAAAFG